MFLYIDKKKIQTAWITLCVLNADFTIKLRYKGLKPFASTIFLAKLYISICLSIRVFGSHNCMRSFKATSYIVRVKTLKSLYSSFLLKKLTRIGTTYSKYVIISSKSTLSIALLHEIRTSTYPVLVMLSYHMYLSYSMVASLNEILVSKTALANDL